MSWAEYKKKRKEQENMETSYSRENNDSNNETSSWQKYKQKREEQKVQQTETLPVVPKSTANLTEIESNTDKSVEEYREKMEKNRQNTNYNVPTVDIMVDAKGNVHKITDWQSARNAEELEKLGDYKYTTANVDENGNIISINDNVKKSTNSNKDFKEYVSNLTPKDIITEMLPVANNIGSVYAPNTSYILTKTAKGEVDAFNKMENWGRSHYGQFLESMASKTDNQEKSDKYQQKAEEQRNKIEQNYNDIQRQIYRNSDVNNIGNTLGDVGQTIGEMSPAILANFIPVVGKFVSPVVSATTVAGGDIGEGIIEDGESFKKANIGGDLKGTASAVIEKLVGGVNIGGAGALDDIVGNTIAKKTTNNITNFLATKGYQIFGEVAEENIENLVDYAIDKIVDDKDFPELKTIWTEAKETSKMTFLTTLALNCLGFGGENLSTYKEMENITGKTLTKTQKESLNRVIEDVQDKIQKTEAPELAQNVQNNIEQQTIQTSTKTAQNQNMSQINNDELQTRGKNINVPVKELDYFETAKKYNIDTKNDTVQSIARVTNEREIKARYDADVFNDNSQNAIWKISKDNNGNITREVIINPNADTKKSLENIAIHELTHDLEGTEQYNKLRDLILEYDKTKSGYQEARQSLEELYSNVYDKNSEEFNTLVDSEAVADILGSKLGNQEFVNNLTIKNKNLGQRIYSWVIDKLNRLNAKLGYKSEKIYWTDIKNKFENAFKQEYQGLDTNKTKLSIQQNNNGKYVKADRQVITGNDSLKWETQVENYINNNIRQGKDVQVETESGDILTITKDTAGKAKFRNKITDKNGNTRYLNNKEFLSKLTAETHVDELAQISQKINKKPIPDYKNHKFARDGFDYRSAYFEDFDGQYYKITMSVGKNGSIDTIYNIGKMDKKNRSKSSLVAQRPSDKNITSNEDITSTNSIAPIKDDVNTTTKYSIQESEKNSQNHTKNLVEIKNNESKYIDNNGKEQDIYFRFDEKNGFKGKEHRSGDQLWENKVDDLIFENYESDYDANDNFMERNKLLEKYSLTQEQYDDLSYEEQKKVKMQIADDYLSYEDSNILPLSSGASSFKLSNSGIDVIGNNMNALLNEYSGEDDIVTFYTGNLKNDKGVWGEPIVEPNKVLYTTNSKSIINILQNENLSKDKKFKQITEILKENTQVDKKYSQNNKTWQDYLEKNYKTAGTRTNLEDIKINNNIAPIGKNVKRSPLIEEIAPKATTQVKNSFDKNEDFKVPKVLKDIPKDKSPLKVLKDEFIQATVNKGHYVDQLAKQKNNPELTYKYDRNLGAFAEGQFTIGRGQTDNNGKIIGKSVKEIWKPAEKANLVNEFSEYLLYKHNVDRINQNNPLLGYEINAPQSAEIAKKLETKYPQFKEWAKDVYTYYNNELQNFVDAGIITEEFKNQLNEMYPHYVKISRNIENNFNVKNDEKVAGGKNPIKRATGGNSDILPLKETMASYAIQAKKAIRQNELGKEVANTLKLKDVIKKNNKSVYEEIARTNDSNVAADMFFNSINNSLVDNSDGQTKLIYYDDGDIVNVKIDEKLYKSLDTKDVFKDFENSNILTKSVSKSLQKVSKIQRDLLTTYNLGFAMVNPIKDIQDGAFNSKYPGKFAQNYAKAIGEMTKGKKSELYMLYLANGGNSNTYYEYDTKMPTQNYKFGDGINKANEVVETLPRFAEFISTIESGGSINEAMYNAAEITTNFKRGGNFTKFLNRNGANFLNASVQGLSKQIRNITGQNGWRGYAQLITKSVLLGVAPALLNDVLLGDDDEYEELPDYIKDEYYLFKKADGNFVRIPKGRVLSVIGMTARRTVEATKGNEEAFNDWWSEVVSQMAPNNPLEDNIAAPIKAVKDNKTWYGTNIVSSRLQKELPKNQYDETTDEFSKWLGEKINVSPKKINYLIDQYSGGIGDIVLPKITPQAKDNIIQDKFTANSTLKNKNPSKFYELLEETTQLANDVEPVESDVLKAKYLNSVNSDMSKLYKEKRTIQMSDMTREAKKETVEEIQSKINSLAEKAINESNNVTTNINYATVRR